MLCSAAVDPLDALLDLEGVAAELLAQGQRRRVLGVGAADLDDVLERRRPCRPARRAACCRPGSVTSLRRHRRGDVHRGREGVVGATGPC